MTAILYLARTLFFCSLVLSPLILVYHFLCRALDRSIRAAPRVCLPDHTAGPGECAVDRHVCGNGNDGIRDTGNGGHPHAFREQSRTIPISDNGTEHTP